MNRNNFNGSQQQCGSFEKKNGILIKKNPTKKILQKNHLFNHDSNFFQNFCPLFPSLHNQQMQQHELVNQFQNLSIGGNGGNISPSPALSFRAALQKGNGAEQNQQQVQQHGQQHQSGQIQEEVGDFPANPAQSHQVQHQFENYEQNQNFEQNSIRNFEHNFKKNFDQTFEQTFEQNENQENLQASINSTQEEIEQFANSSTSIDHQAIIQQISSGTTSSAASRDGDASAEKASGDSQISDTASSFSREEEYPAELHDIALLQCVWDDKW